MSAEPLEVECPACGSGVGNPCLRWYRDMPMIAFGPRKPHAARVRAAAEKKEGERG